MVLFQVGEGQILEVSDSLVALFGASREEMLGRPVLEFVVDEAGARARLELMTAGRLDGYHVLAREFRRLDGSEFTVDTCVNGLWEVADHRHAIAMLLPRQRPPASQLPDATGAVVLGTVNDEWEIDRIGAAVEQVLGFLPRDVVGEAISTFVEPADLPGLLAGVGHALQTPHGAMIPIRLRTADGMHRHCRMLLTRLGGVEREGIGFAFVITDHELTRVVERAWELEGVLQRIARDIEASGVLTSSWAVSSTTNLPALSRLSQRESEVVTRLLTGDRVMMIAQQLFISESTVRNHLTSVYRKLGVRSQQQLLSLLRAGQPPGNQEVSSRYPGDARRR